MSKRRDTARGGVRVLKNRKSARELREMRLRLQRYGGPRPETNRNLNQGFIDAGDPGTRS